MKLGGGFTLVEMAVVLAVIAILAVMAVPSGEGRFNQQAIRESVDLLDRYRPLIEAYYQLNGNFPADNTQASMPAADKLVGNYLVAVEVVDGAMHLQLGQKINKKLIGQRLSLRPVYVADTPNAPVSWVCGYDAVPEGMTAAGENRSDIKPGNLPLSCR